MMRHKQLNLAQILENWPKLIPQNSNICVGLSGGIDSIVLLHILKNCTPIIKLSAVHVNHGISANANSWAQFCQSICNDLDIPLQIENVSLQRSGGESLENIARIARHNIFLQNNSQIIALAHHQDDQVETTLSQLFRGSDLHNIAAMHEVSNKQNKLIWRPLLHISKVQIEEYAEQFNLEHITDESNFDTKYLRNFIRHDIMPILNHWDNNIVNKILNFNSQLQKLLIITDDVAKEDLATCSPDSNTIWVDKLGSLTHERQTNLLSLFIQANNLPLPTQNQLTEFARQAISSDWDKKPQLKLNLSTLLVKYKNTISLELLNNRS